jgi:hypothetical protein
MFTNFQSGQIDITDWPMFPSDISSFCGNPDFFCGSQQSEFGIFQLDINHHASLLGVAQQQARTTTAPGIIGSTTTATTVCASGFGRLTVLLVNKEQSNAQIKDIYNTVTAAGPQSFTVLDSDNGGVGEPDGNYTLPSTSTCMLAGTYTISSSVYAGTASIFVGNQQAVVVTLGLNYNSPSTTMTTTKGIQFRKALAHLLDKPEFILSSTLQGRASCDDLWAPPSQNLPYGSCAPASDSLAAIPQTILDQECSDHPWYNPGNCNPTSAYLFNNTALGPGKLWWAATGSSTGSDNGYPSMTDLRAACDDLVLAGFAIAPSGKTCGDVASASVGLATPACATATYSCPHLVATGQLVFYIRTHPPREAFGQIMADGLNFLFGTPNNGAPSGGTSCVVNYGYKSPGAGCTPTYYTITDIAGIIFGSNPLDDWNLYTGGVSVTSTPDDLYSSLHSQFASNVCGGISAAFPSNYLFYCNPVFDSQAAAGEFSSSLSQAINLFTAGAVIGYQTVMNVPVFSRLQQFVALNGWNFQGTTTPQRSSLVNALGTGFEAGTPGGYFSLLNMNSAPGYDPCAVPGAPFNCAAYKSGGGMAGLIRRSLSQGTDNLSPFQATTVWDFDVINQVYDSMLQPDPLTGGSVLQMVNWMVTSHQSSFNPVEISCVHTTCVNGTTTQTWRLRNDLMFHDGTRVTADDVVFSILAYRDVPSAQLQPQVASVAGAVALNPSVVQVKLQHQSPFYDVNIGTLPILPKHIWGPLCGTPIGAPGNQCANPSFDPMASGDFIGSGPWVCKSVVTGAIGGTCSQNGGGSPGTQSLGPGGRILLTANPSYMRGPVGVQGTSLQKFNWADKFDSGFVNIADLADMALHYTQPEAYWAHPLYSSNPSTGAVDIGDISTVALYMGHGLTSPWLLSQATALDPRIDPFRIDLTSQLGPVMYYEGGVRTSSNLLNIKLVAISGTATPSSFSGTLTTPSGTIVGTTTGAAGNLPTITMLSFSGIVSGQYQLTVSFSGSVAFTITLNV